MSSHANPFSAYCSFIDPKAHLNVRFAISGTLDFSDTHSDMSYVFINDSSQTSVPLLQACIDGDLPFAKRLLETGCDPNIRDNRGRTGLHLAAARGNVEICRLLHKFGADLLATDYQGNTALHLCGHVDTIQFLVSNGLKIDIWWECGSCTHPFICRGSPVSSNANFNHCLLCCSVFIMSPICFEYWNCSWVATFMRYLLQQDLYSDH